MPGCPRCSNPVDDAALFCASCGTPIRARTHPPATVDRIAEAATVAPDAPAENRAASQRHHEPAELLPGSVIAGRYRIVARVGRGGMGEVYRADDLTLGHPVALKFMAASLAVSPARRDRFISEVRVARQITHPNVCRVHDIGFRDAAGLSAGSDTGQPYLSMEFVDGEDLASLLRRIGRLPQDKAAQVGAQLCAGLGAAHARGVLHRDLKPANIMLDGRGQVRITDFGLAEFAADLNDQPGRAGRIAGTPAYMAPEQLAGRALTVRTDLFALGLVLYELFTGERAVREGAIDTIAEQVGSRDFALPGTRVKDLDPAIEAVIMRCLEPRPEDRPASAAAVAAVLPGGDALAGALAAGQTPDPSVLAASGDSGRIPIAAGAAWLAACIVGVLAVAWLNKSVSLLGILANSKPPAVLAERTRELIRTLGYERDRGEEGGSAAWGVRHNIAMLDYIELHADHSPAPGWWSSLREQADTQKHGPSPAPLEFWYRQAPVLISPSEGATTITPDDPAPIPGEVRVDLDMQGRLVRLAVQPRINDLAATADNNAATIPQSPEPVWPSLLAAAGFDRSDLTPATASDAAMIGDSHAAWTARIADGPLAGQTGRIEAASLRGRPLLFHTVWPWGLTSEGSSPTPMLQRVIVLLFTVPLILTPVAVGAIMARRNWRAGRGDRRGAIRVAVAAVLLTITVWILGADHAAAVAELNRVAYAIGEALLVGLTAWTMYLALEPAVRRRRPGAILSWTRLTSGRWRDPMIGRDVLRGATLGAAWAATYKLIVLIASRLPDAPAPTITPDESLSGVPAALSQIADGVNGSIFWGLLMLMALLVLGKTGRWRWPARIAFGVVVLLLGVLMLPLLGQPQAGNSVYYLMPVGFLTSAGYFLVLARLGLLTAIAFTASIWALLALPTTLDSSAWYGPMGLCAVVAVIGAAAWGAWASAFDPSGMPRRAAESASASFATRE